MQMKITQMIFALYTVKKIIVIISIIIVTLKFFTVHEMVKDNKNYSLPVINHHKFYKITLYSIREKKRDYKPPCFSQTHFVLNYHIF